MNVIHRVAGPLIMCMISGPAQARPTGLEGLGPRGPRGHGCIAPHTRLRNNKTTEGCRTMTATVPGTFVPKWQLRSVVGLCVGCAGLGATGLGYAFTVRNSEIQSTLEDLASQVKGVASQLQEVEKSSASQLRGVEKSMREDFRDMKNSV